MKEPTKEELKQLILDLFEVICGYRRGHDGRTEPYDCDCQFCKRVDDILDQLGNPRDKDAGV
jgi:hypothetical protein